jgi:hypothetical protein
VPSEVTYCETTDLDWGGMPSPANAQHWVSKGAEEIDSIVGMRYATPVILGNSAEERPAKLLLKRINEWLAMGRAILSQAIGGEDTTTHAQGRYYVDEALKALMAIANGDIVLPNVPLSTPEQTKETGPLIQNLDDASLVESFDSVFGNAAKTALALPRPVCIMDRVW